MDDFQIKYINRGIRHWHESPTVFHSHQEIKIVVALHGVFVLETRSDEYEINASSAIVVPPLLSHRFIGREQAVEMLVMTFRNLNADWERSLVRENEARPIFLDAMDMSLVEELHRRCAEEALRDDAMARMILNALGQAWIAMILRASSRQHGVARYESRLQKAREQIVAGFDKPFRIGELARRVGMSEALFRKEYRRWFGCSPKGEIMLLRIRKAQTLLFETDEKLAEVAERCGFCNEHEFSRSFRSQVGLSPGRWRKQH